MAIGSVRPTRGCIDVEDACAMPAGPVRVAAGACHGGRRGDHSAAATPATWAGQLPARCAYPRGGPKDARSREIAAFLRAAIRAQTGIAVQEGAAAHGIELKLDPAVQGDEAYRLAVTSKRITVSASTDKGLFWG